MGFLGGEIGYRLLCAAAPPACQREGQESPHITRNKLEICFGHGIWELASDKVVIDFGCGVGAQTVQLAQHGARRVIGIDIRRNVLEIGLQKAKEAGVEDRCFFTEKTEERADLVISVDSFEHFADPAQILALMARLLKPGGTLLISFGPPWYHPMGGHLFSVFPWSHLIFSEHVFMRWRSSFKADGARRFCEVEGGLNRMSIKRFCRLVNDSQFCFKSLETVPIRKTRILHNRLTREFLTSIVRCALKINAQLPLELKAPRLPRRTPFQRSLIQGVKTILVSPVFGSIQRFFSGGGTILMYHSITHPQRQGDVFCPNLPLMVEAGEFDRQMAFLAENFRCLDMDSFVRQLNQGELQPGSIAITFDDGYRDNLLLALPILEKYRIPAVIYVITDLLEEKGQFWWHELEQVLGRSAKLEFAWSGQSYCWVIQTSAQKQAAFNTLNSFMMSVDPEEQERLMLAIRGRACRGEGGGQILGWEDIKKLAEHPLITIGSHGRRHLVLSRLSDNDLVRELVDSRKTIEQEIGRPVRHHAYPFGSRGEVGSREFEAALSAGYASAVTTRWGHVFCVHREHLHALPRMEVTYQDTLMNFRWKLSGLEAMRRNGGKRIIFE